MHPIDFLVIFILGLGVLALAALADDKGYWRQAQWIFGIGVGVTATALGGFVFTINGF